MNYNLIGKRIRELRIDNGLTQNDLAQRLSCSSKHLGNIERGTSRPSLECLLDISNALNVTLDYLVSESVSISKNDAHSELVLTMDHFLEDKQEEFQQMRKLLRNNIKQE
jgi:transcriptional regulator with XRE-family HTH domain